MNKSETGLEFLRRCIEEATGVLLEENKGYLVETRLSHIVQRMKLPSCDALLDHLATSRDAALRREVVEAMLTNESSFFRDPNCFEQLHDHIVPGILERNGNRQLNIWCAACAAGQEACSVVMLLEEEFAKQLAGWEIRIVASDYSRQILKQATAGAYNSVEVGRGLSSERLARHFRQEGGVWHLKHELRSMIDYREMNLVAPWPTMPPLDIVLLRNVMIYMRETTRRQILANIRQLLRPGGYLILGATEVAVETHEFESIRHGQAMCYRRSVE